jgi:hypothetical protein
MEFNEIFGDVNWDKEYVTRDQAKEWFESVKDQYSDKKSIWSDLETYIISVVDEPSHRSTFLDLKSKDNMKRTRELEYTVTKSDDELQIAKAAAMVPDEPDADGDITPPWLVKRGAHDFMANKNTDQVDEMHETPPVLSEAIETHGSVVESYVLEEEQKYESINGETHSYPAGTWMIKVRFEDDDVWQKVKSGEYTGYSIHGRAEKEEIKSSDVSKDNCNCNSVFKEDEDPCWENYEMVGIDENGDPICVPEEDAHETRSMIKNNFDTEGPMDEGTKQSSNKNVSMAESETEQEEAEQETEEQESMDINELAETVANNTDVSKDKALKMLKQEGDYEDGEESGEEEEEQETEEQEMDMEKITDMMEEMLDRVEDLEEDVYSDDADTEEDMEDEEQETEDDEQESEGEPEQEDEESDQKSADQIDRKATMGDAPEQKSESDEDEESDSVFAEYWN